MMIIFFPSFQKSFLVRVHGRRITRPSSCHHAQQAEAFCLQGPNIIGAFQPRSTLTLTDSLLGSVQRHQLWLYLSSSSCSERRWRTLIEHFKRRASDVALTLLPNTHHSLAERLMSDHNQINLL